MKDCREKNLLDLLSIMAPGTSLRDGLENVLKAKTGGLIVIGDEEEIMKITDGGFYINSEYSPAYLYELAKMDGAIVISTDMKRIIYANAQLLPDASINTRETGTRHRTAERVSKQTGGIVIAISQRRNLITVYRGNLKYILKDTNTVLNKANQAVQTLERYKVVLDEAITNISALEFEDLVTVYDVANTVQRYELVMRIVYEIERFICELGDEGRLVSMQLDDLIGNMEEEGELLIKDYTYEKKDYEEVLKSIKTLSAEDIVELNVICKLLGYSPDSMMETMISSKGYRLLNRIPRMPQSVIENLIKEFMYLKRIMRATIEQLDDVEGIGEARAKAIREGLRKIQEQVLIDRNI
ncbi:DNA integrity scanning diadenylate cyclase DisA [Clostridium cylindrosporum]|uniref:DNA integrity scanning protein DisA n=1 Tax=Clostridium cylindrosporum DSM 605 TaxID=1121307 RepID=A0A0J8G402_CLOCY|nr:DNA integrity scanning diadenylate cyclase DisA [Clostridium cylindrosporum]KMT22431.1 DNA integrity scanning protein DisA [Clostridium cylindrosporum DSM 605]